MTNNPEPVAHPEQCVMVCPQCEGEGGYPDGLDEDACHTDCTRCAGDGWIVDLAALRGEPVAHADLVEQQRALERLTAAASKMLTDFIKRGDELDTQEAELTRLRAERDALKEELAEAHKAMDGGWKLAELTTLRAEIARKDEALRAKPWPPSDDELREMLAQIAEAWWPPSTANTIRAIRNLRPEDINGMYAIRDVLAPYIARAALKEQNHG